ncbi:rab-GTPase-TBC domain-containing protein [Parasitella parasitica]|nr:rab-GTPase-TBC domain-containing protein [Parasitella parasitica]
MYGFKRPFQWVNKSKLIEFEQRYKLVQKKQARGWKKLIVNSDQQWPALCPQREYSLSFSTRNKLTNTPSRLVVSRYVRKGIPHAMRAKVWMHYSGANKKLQENPGQYLRLLETDAKSEHAEAIQKDLHRTFPDNLHFSCDVQHKDGSTTVAPESNQKIQQLRRVLLAFSVHSPSIGYCQSLNFLAGFLLLILSEEEAFWMLVTIVHDIFPQNVFDTTMEGANIEQTVLMMMLYEKMPGIWTKMASKKCFWECEQKEELPPITLLTSHWFLTLFINILPVETVLRIWDCFFVGEGCKVLYQVALTIFKLNEQRIRNATDSTETFQILQNMPKRMIDCDQFMKCVFSPENDVAQVSNKDINSKRDLFKSRKLQRRMSRNTN